MSAAEKETKPRNQLGMFVCHTWSSKLGAKAFLSDVLTQEPHSGSLGMLKPTLGPWAGSVHPLFPSRREQSSSQCLGLSNTHWGDSLKSLVGSELSIPAECPKKP